MCNCAEEKKFVGNTEIHKGGPLRPYDLGRRPLQPVKNYKSQLSLGVLVIQTSCILSNMLVNHSLTSYLQKELEP